MKNIFDKIKKGFDFFKKHSDIIGYICLIIFFIFMNYKLYVEMDYLIDSDMSSELVLAKLLASEKRFITTEWFYSSEIRVLNTNLVFMPLFLITNNWHTVRIAGIVILDLILFGSFYYLAKQLNIKHIPWIGFLVLGGVSRDYLLFVTLGSFYIPHFVLSFLSIGLVFSIIKDERKNIRLIKLGILLLLAFAAGLEGMRLVSLCYLPLLATSFLYCLIKEFSYLKRGSFNLKEPSLKIIYLSVVIFISSLIGMFFNKVILPGHGYIYKMDGTDLFYSEFDITKVGMLIDGWLDVFGYQSGNLEVFSIEQLILKPLFAVYFLVSCWSTIDIFIHKENYNKYELFTNMYFLIGFVIINALFIFTTNPYTNRYLLPVSIFSFFILGIFLSNYKIEWQKWSMIVLITFFVILNTFFQIDYQKYNNVYLNDSLRNCEKIILNEKCYAGYSIDHWNGHNLFTELTDGRIETYRFNSGNIDRIGPWLQAVEHSYKKPEGKVYLLLLQEEKDQITFKMDVENYKYYEDEERILYIFDSYTQLKDLTS